MDKRKIRRLAGSKMFPPIVLSLVLFCVSTFLTVTAQGPEAYFNGSSYVVLQNTLSIKKRISFSFRTCSHGQLLFQEGSNDDYLEFSLLPSGQLEMHWNVQRQEGTIRHGSDLINNQWQNIDLIYHLGNLSLFINSQPTLVANNSYQSELLHLNLSSSQPMLVIGRYFTGCMLQGPGIVFSTSTIHSVSVAWTKCPLPNIQNCVGYSDNHCFTQPCQKNGRCISIDESYYCQCTTRYSGKNCDIDNGPLCHKPEFNQCQNGGNCHEDKIGNSTFCSCPTNFTGMHCEIVTDTSLCENQPCLNGGTCNVNEFRNGYVCTCREGFAGVNCELNIDECQSSPCLNNGSCTDEINSYSCDCTLSGYKGINCENNINECEELQPCSSGSTCYDRYGDYICDCLEGIGGKNCDEDIDECLSSPCQNGATCIDQLGSYGCHCPLGYDGLTCDNNIDDCLEVACPINSTCMDGINHYTCVCLQGYSGTPPYCYEINECISYPCHNGGTCHDITGGFMCSCPSGYSGQYCEEDVNECSSNPCVNGGRCIDGSSTYLCDCSDGYTGTNCEIDINECASNPCQNSSRCTDLVNGYLCDCLPGWEGRNCDINKDECSFNPCLHGQCIDLVNNYTCVCDSGYIGAHCEENNDDCQSNPCLNGGHCTDLINDYSCLCLQNFMGKNCSEIYNACYSAPCHNGGQCHTTPPLHDFNCTCPIGFIGAHCETNIDECQGIVCPPGQMCFDLVNAYECRCPDGFTGSDCSIDINECASNPCVNGTCIDNVSGYTCNCPNGLTGKNCEQDIDECLEQPCANGICRNLHGSHLCYCLPGFTGHNCHIEFDECLSNPCRNNGTCLNLVNDYSCVCAAGFTERNCETNIDECASQPCMNGGTCIDKINEYQCVCPLGFTGSQCEVNIDECASSPCENDGICIDLINGYECNCTNTGFTGINCEYNINDCESNPCQHGSSCEDQIKNYSCHCHPGYEGKNCETDILECLSSPCQNFGDCLEKSNVSLYNINYMGLFPYFSYESAGGYICNCASGFTGNDCEVNIDDCENNSCDRGICVDGINEYHCQCLPGYEGQYCSDEINECEQLMPCENGATCTDEIADYHCKCTSNYGGKNCSILLIGCDSNQCQNEATCEPYLTETGEHKYHCLCPKGFHGELCDKITTASFSGSGLWMLPSFPSSDNHKLQMQFRTTLPKGILVQGFTHQPPFAYIVYMIKGAVHLSVFNNSGLAADLVIRMQGLNDSNWKDLEVTFQPSMIELNVSGFINSATLPLTSVAFSSHLGGISPDLSDMFRLSYYVPDFIGCMQEVYVNGNVVIPDSESSSLINVTLGCSREDQCQPNPCFNRGHCNDLWSSYQCICSRPFFGEKCKYSFIPATFGYQNTSTWAKLVPSLESKLVLQTSFNISLFIRTRKSSGLILYIGSELLHEQSYGSTQATNTFFIMRLDNGKLQVLLKVSDEEPVLLQTDERLDDGNYYYLMVSRNENYLHLKINDTIEKTLETPGGSLEAEVIYIGGIARSNRRKRQVTLQPSGVVSYALDNITQTSFKGIIKDLRINEEAVEFFPLNETGIFGMPKTFSPAELSNDIQQGEISDNPCLSNPCVNGECYDMWNKFSCQCFSGFRGLICDEPEPCSVNKCPEQAECRNLEVGYECVTSSAFNGKDSFVEYKVHSVDQDINNLTILFRTQNPGSLLEIRRNSNFFLKVKISDSVQVEWNLGPSENDINIKTSAFSEVVTDGEWHNITILFEGYFIKVSVDGLTQRISEDISGRGLGELINSNASVYLGHSPSLDERIDKFKGCLGEVRIGGLLLPFYTLSELNTTLTSSPFSITNKNIEIGCILCWNEDCQHGGICEDNMLSYGCTCPNGFRGQQCEDDLCDSENPCQNGGTCEHGENGLFCRCTPNFTDANCTTEVDHCESQPCQNGGTCHQIDGGYECVCTANYEGHHCEIQKNCESQPCKNGGTCTTEYDGYSQKLQCICPRNWIGRYCTEEVNFCESNPCINGICNNTNMTESGFLCLCNVGYKGETCNEKTYPCESNPCRNDGICRNSSSTDYTCTCLRGYIGINCEKEVLCTENETLCVKGICDPYTAKCKCTENYFGKHCDIRSKCLDNPCKNDGICRNIDHGDSVDFNCTCKNGFFGKTCHEKETAIAPTDSDTLVIIIVIPVVCILLLCLLIGAIVFLRIARKKRATRGTYSPSRQEMFGSRVEMNHVMKPPPEERLI